MKLTIGSTHQDQHSNKITVLDIRENFEDKSRIVLHKKNNRRKVLQSFQDVLMETIQRKERVQ